MYLFSVAWEGLIAISVYAISIKACLLIASNEKGSQAHSVFEQL